MKLLVVGGGGREHAIIKKLKENPAVEEIFALPGNGGIAKDATCVDIAATDLDGVVKFAKENKIDYAVVAPDDPLVLGLVDLLSDLGIPCFGPNKAAAIIEGSKAFSKELMKKYNIPTAKYEIFSDMNKAFDYVSKQKMPIVIKADGLALGKGVIIAETYDEAKIAIKSMMEDKVFGDSGNHIVIEEFKSLFPGIEFVQRKVYLSFPFKNGERRMRNTTMLGNKLILCHKHIGFETYDIFPIKGIVCLWHYCHISCR